MNKNYTITWTKKAKKDLELLKQKPALVKNMLNLLSIIEDNPYQYRNPFKLLSDNLQGKFSIRLNLQHRLVYEIDEQNKEVVVLRAWTHYEGV